VIISPAEAMLSWMTVFVATTLLVLAVLAAVSRQ
jgi:hypothetical protein